MKTKRGILAIVLALVMTFAFSGCQFVQVDPEVDKETIVAEIGEEKIKKEEFTKLFDRIKKQYDGQVDKEYWEKETDGKKNIDVFKERVLEAIIENKILLNKAKEMNIAVTDEEVTAEIDKIREEYFDTEEQFNEFLTSQNITIEELKEEKKMEMTVNKLRDKLVEAIQVTDDDAAVYYSNNINMFETVKASHILVETEEKAKELKAQIDAGKDFAALAKENSMDPGTKDAGGDLGYFRRGDMVEEFETAAFALKPGEVSEIIPTNYGFHIIKVEDKKVETLEEVKEQLKTSLLNQKKSEEYNKLVDEMVKAANVKKYLNRL